MSIHYTNNIIHYQGVSIYSILLLSLRISVDITVEDNNDLKLALIMVPWCLLMKGRITNSVLHHPHPRTKVFFVIPGP